ncbi:porin [Caballeronia sp. LZ001]|uniref:porin n=1 Tax=Caballeronia sp. LZ001 TaxID=3038553 RepID=UPI00285B503F|nr:porin [Caballeronia sp. LZ001]MDR5804865.1 porin [Caballeronia sp. LZ001]
MYKYINARSVGVLFLGALSSIARAQSSVTIYGIIDQAVQYTSNVAGGKKIALDSLAGQFGSRLGLTGSEDLGNGLHAIFTLENGLNIDSGSIPQGGTLWGRQAFVGLSSDRYGAVTFGRQYDTILYFVCPLTAACNVGGAVSGPPGDINNVYIDLRWNNSVRYMSPSYHGFTFGAEYAFGGTPGDFTKSSGYSLGAGYTMGPVKLGAAFAYFKNPASTPGSGLFTGNANGSSPVTWALNKAYANAGAWQSANLAATYTLGAVTFAGSYSNVQYANLGPTFSTQTAIFNNFDVGAKYQVTPAFYVALAYDYLIADGVETAGGHTVGNQHINQLALLGSYSLTKRTSLYLGGSYQRASGTSSLGTAAVANIDNLGDSSNNHQFLVRAAIMHKF